MQTFGQVLCAVGMGLLIWAGLIGVDPGIGGQIRVINIAGLIGGAGLFVGGAVFCAGASIVEAIQVSSEDHFRMIDHGFDDMKVMIGYPIDKVPDVAEREEERGLLSSVVKGRYAKKYYFMGKRFETRKTADEARARFIAKYGRA